MLKFARAIHLSKLTEGNYVQIGVKTVPYELATRERESQAQRCVQTIPGLPREKSSDKSKDMTAEREKAGPGTAIC